MLTQRKDGSSADAGTIGTAYGVLAQVAARLIWDQEAAGSSPAYSTTRFYRGRDWITFFRLAAWNRHAPASGENVGNAEVSNA